MNNGAVQGGCLCGAVRFTVQKPLRRVWACHCSQCRRTSGHYWAATATALERFELTASQTLRWYQSSENASRGFCARCGASLFWRQKESSQISIGAGCLDGQTGLTTEWHIYMEHAGDYYRIHPQDPVRADSALDDD